MNIVPPWRLNMTGFVSQHFRPNFPTGPRNIPVHINKDSTPLDFFSIFWDDTVWELLVNETNRQAAHVKTTKPNNYVAKNWTEVTLNEMKAFFGCRITIESLVHKDRYEQYWKTKDNLLTATPGFPKIMSQDRFLAIWSMLHCVNEEDPTVDKMDKIYKSRPIFNYLIDNFQHHFVPDCELSLDEGMIPTKNSLSIKQYIKDKPIKWGLKTFLLTDSKHGYIMNAEVYTGKRADALTVDNLGITGNLVVRMTQDFQNQNYILFMDRFYTSVELAEYLLNKGIGMCGTAMTNRKEFPKFLKRTNKQMHRGDCEIVYNGNVSALVWMDKRPIYFVSSVYVDAPFTSVPRYDAKEHRRVPVPCPVVVKAYNQFMGGTDKNDQMTRLQKCRRHYKWPRRLIMKFFMWAAYNAYVIQGYYKSHMQSAHRNFTFHFFLEKLCHQLVGVVRNMTQKGRRRSDTDQEIRLGDVGQHVCERAEHATTNNRCVVCTEKYRRAKLSCPNTLDKDLPTKSRTVYWCTYCKMFLCIGKPGANCWHDWHSKVMYWR
ncbi:piggyBac transposable element-derived protein 4-like [Patella vulgata]|uniref:piggyBac transposable element-derived protein 4-like n=1 Tax=Patella vulgata TaxID=6465 RepID=UPI00218004D4|nr:piggyBac transposable element-derived protein 4-like [Patella vulgata]